MISAFELFKIGIGPSSSHTVGPMRAARAFAVALDETGHLDAADLVTIELFGSLAATGRGHATDRAVQLGLMGDTPEGVDLSTMEARLSAVRETGRLALLGRHAVVFIERDHLLFRPSSLPLHPNGMRFTARGAEGDVLLAQVYYSVGGGFVAREDQFDRPASTLRVPHPFRTAQELLERCEASGHGISGLMFENEQASRTAGEVRAGLLRIWGVMGDCIERGTETEGILPGGLKVPRRAPGLRRQLETQTASADPLVALDRVSLWAIAVNEENAFGGRVVTAPTNGAAGIIPAVLKYYVDLVPGADEDGVVRFLLAAAAIGVLFKENASISGAEVGCQGEVGSACSMAAAGLAEVLGGTPGQVENAAEIGLEHNLGLTCDPIGGLVQVPCIERNAMAAVKAINAARLALRGDGRHFVSLDKAIETMRATGADMKTKYKETAMGGLAAVVLDSPVGVNLADC
ncbi:MAG TPA: L-serine ammonia-lyase [Vicinamibacteria bacterium]|nr:L-serine ammonia-lyase [Vicinamibacteria bacterium]